MRAEAAKKHRWGARSSCARVALALAPLLLTTLPARAGSEFPYGGEFHQQLDALFFEPDHPPGAQPLPAKIAAYDRFIASKLDWVQEHVVRREMIDAGKSEADARKQAQGRDITIALVQVQRWLAQLAAVEDAGTAHDLAAWIVTLEYATRAFSEPLESIKIPVHLKNLIFEWRSPNRSRACQAELEATNLVDPESGEFFTPDELALLIRSGFDISTLDPPSETPFWRKREAISQVDITHNYLLGGDPFHEGIVSDFPPYDGVVVELDRVHKTQTKPKLDVFYTPPECAKKSKKKRRKCRQRLKLKLGMEVHADPPANALLSALGWNVDVSMHAKNIRVNLGDHTLEKLRKEWIGYFDQQRVHTYIPIESVLLDVGEDEQGAYVVFQEGVFELKPQEIERIGYFSFSKGMATQFREARALFLYNAWIGNADMKDDGNNKVALRKDESGDYQIFMIQQDLGHSLGWILPERPEAFPWDLVEDGLIARVFGALNGSIEFDYIDLQDNGLLDNATYADLKWMARKIAQLTRQQITIAIELGAWPGGIAELYVEKLINRRNQIVQAFDLEREFELMPVDRQLTTADGSVVNGHLTQNRFEDVSPINFDNHWRDALFPIASYAREMLTSVVQAGLGAVDVINPGDLTIGANVAILPRILLKLSRKVLLNPEPEGAWDQYLVVDTMHFGLRLGVGYIGSGEGAWMKKVTLAYPVSTYREGLYRGLGAMNFLREDASRDQSFPEHYVLYREDLVKTGVRVSSDSTSLLQPLGIEGSQSWVMTHRSVIDRRSENPIVWVDEPRSIERNIQFFFEFFDLIQIPFMGGGTTKGGLQGRAFELDANKLSLENDEGEAIFDAMLHDADFSDADRISVGPARRATSDFSSAYSWWSLVLWSWRARAKQETITLQGPDGETLRVEHQAERRSSFTWAFIDNAEAQHLDVKGYLGGVASDGDAPPEPTVVVTYSVDDKNAHSSEFDSYYRLLEGLGAGQVYIAPGFSAQDWEISGKPSGRWARLLTKGAVHFYPGALERLMQLDRDAYWSYLAANLGMSERELSRHRFRARSVSKSSLVAHRKRGALRIRRLILRSRVVFAILRKARESGPGKERLRLLVKALYRANFRSGQTFDPMVMSSLLQQADVAQLVKDEELYVTGRITRAFEDEQNLPERRDLVGALGKPRDFRRTQYSFFPFSGVELYNMLNWIREADD